MEKVILPLLFGLGALDKNHTPKDGQISTDTEGMKEHFKKLKQLESKNQLSKRKLKKRRAKKGRA